MDCFEHQYILHLSFLSIKIKEAKICSVLKFLHKVFPNKKWFIEVK